MTVTLPRRFCRLFALTFLSAAVGAGSAFAGPIVKVKGEGTYMSLFATDSTGCLWTSVFVSRVGPKTSQSTWMLYDVFDVCSGSPVAFGNGTIPDGAFKVTGKGATLSVTPSSIPGFFHEGLTGSLQLTVVVTGAWSSTFSGHSRTEAGDRRYLSHGSWTYKEVSGSGTVVGFELPSFAGQLGDGRDRYMEIERGVN